MLSHTAAAVLSLNEPQAQFLCTRDGARQELITRELKQNLHALMRLLSATARPACGTLLVSYRPLAILGREPAPFSSVRWSRDTLEATVTNAEPRRPSLGLAQGTDHRF